MVKIVCVLIGLSLRVLMAERFHLFKSDDGRFFYTEEEANEWDQRLENGRNNCIKMLQSKSSPEKIHPKVDKVIQELVPSEFEDFVVSIESISKALTNFAFRKKDDWANDYWNTRGKIPDEERWNYSIRKLKRIEQFGGKHDADIDWVREHEVAFPAPRSKPMLE